MERDEAERVNGSVTAPPTDRESKPSTGFIDSAGCFGRLLIIWLI